MLNDGLKLWESAKNQNVCIFFFQIQTFQNKVFCEITNAPSYVDNLTVHTNFKIKILHKEAADFYKRFHSKLSSNLNSFISNFMPLLLLLVILRNNPKQICAIKYSTILKYYLK